ncbi:type-2 histone deacetylase 1-like [Chenopodium quinoa]|uniref:type-2 histone deacetylase 1-like n=1 Tax=Chenopodium quinoa TaxID=63459 RepID=UPI000B76C2B3|nr:type-2 histone deacetylase 1-like [Chenopodium quinoa]
MAEDLDDGEFWLPSHFLTDDDILMDFDFSAPKVPNSGLGFVGYGSSSSNSNSDLELTSGCTETESDEEDILLSGLTRKIARVDLQDSSCPVHSKGYVLSSSPQSTLCGCFCNHGSSRESLSPPQPPPQNNDKSDDNNKENSNNATLDLLNKAAGEVARLKMKTEKSTGTGFFDCSQKEVLYPSPLRNPDHFPPIYYQPQFHHFPPMVWAPSNGVQYNQAKQQPLPQNRATNNNKSNNKSNGNNNSNRPLGLPPSAWPTLQQVQAQNQAHPMPPQPMFVGPKRECNGTGVFLPRSVTTTPSVPRKKADGNATKSSKTGKGSQSQSSNRRNASATTTPTASNNDIQLPQEWTY